MEMLLQTDTPPLNQDNSGAIRVGDSHVLLELVVRAFDDGATPETIVQQYPTTTLAEIYGVIAYYLRHTDKVREYMAEREQTAIDVRQKIEKSQGDLADLRARILARKISS